MMLRIDQLLKLGFTVVIRNEKLIVSPKESLTEEIRLYIKEFKHDLTAELFLSSLPNNERIWLLKVAYHLNVSSVFLLKYKFIDEFDLVEQINTPPILVSNSIRNSLGWDEAITEEHAKNEKIVCNTNLKLEHRIKDNPCFTQFIDHLMRTKGTCCHAPANRYCEAGKALKIDYTDSYNASCP